MSRIFVLPPLPLLAVAVAALLAAAIAGFGVAAFFLTRLLLHLTKVAVSVVLASLLLFVGGLVVI